MTRRNELLRRRCRVWLVEQAISQLGIPAERAHEVGQAALNLIEPRLGLTWINCSQIPPTVIQLLRRSFRELRSRDFERLRQVSSSQGTLDSSLVQPPTALQELVEREDRLALDLKRIMIRKAFNRLSVPSRRILHEVF